MQHFANYLRSRVGEGRSKLVLTVLNDFLPNQMPLLQHECLMLQANLSQAERDFANGLATRAEVQQNIAKVNGGLLQLISEIAKQPGDDQAALDAAKHIEASFQQTEFTPKPTGVNSAFLWGGFLVMLALAGLGGWYWASAPEAAQDLPAKIQIEEQQIKPKTPSIAEQKIEQAAWLKKTEDLTDQGQWLKALEAVNNAFGKGFDNAELFNTRANILLHLERYAEARDDARKGVALKPDYCLSYVTLAQAQAKIGDEEDFYRNIETALRKRCEVWKYTQQIGLSEFKNKPRFRRLVDRYK